MDDWSNQIWLYTKWREAWEVLPGKWQCLTLTSILRRLLRDFLLHPQRPLKDHLLHPQSSPEGSSAQSSDSWGIFCCLKETPEAVKDLLLCPQETPWGSSAPSSESETPGGSYAPSSETPQGSCFILKRFLKDHRLHPQGLLRDLLLSPRDSWSSEGSPSSTLSSRDFWGIFCSILRDSWGIFC